MVCPKCSYQSSTEGIIFCPACGFRFNPNCEIALVHENSVYTRIFKLDKPYPQSITMQIDGKEPLHPTPIEPNTGGQLVTMRFDFKDTIEEGFHSVRVRDTLRAKMLLNDSPVQFLTVRLPSFRVNPTILLTNGLLKISVSNIDPELSRILVFYYSINDSSPKRIGFMENGEHEFMLTDWQSYGVEFEKSDFFRTKLKIYYRFWDELDLQPLTNAPLSFVNRVRLNEISYHGPGLEPQSIKIDDKFGQESAITTKEPLMLYTYQNPVLETNWQRDKRYLKIREAWKDLLNPESGEEVPWESFEVSVEHNHDNLDIAWIRLQKHNPLDSILRINEAKNPGVHNVDLVLGIPDASYPDGKAVFRIPARIQVINEWTQPYGLGLDFGTSRTMVSLLHKNKFDHKVVGLEIDNFGLEYEDKLAQSIIPQNKEDYEDAQIGTIYSYICTELDLPMTFYIKRELPGILRSDMESLAELRETFEAIFETLLRRVTEYTLQTEQLIPKVTDICLGCPTVFSDNIIQQYRDFLRNVCRFTPIQTDPGFEVTVWDEVWAAFNNINTVLRPEPGYYLVWDMGGGTTDTVLVDQTTPGRMPIVGFNSDFFGGKDINEQIKKIWEESIGQKQDQLTSAHGSMSPSTEESIRQKLDQLTEDRIDTFKINVLSTGEGDLDGVDVMEINKSLKERTSKKIGDIASGLINCMKRMGAQPDEITLLSVGGGSLLKFADEDQGILTLGDLIKTEIEKLLPETRIKLLDLQNEGKAYSVDPKACTCLGLSSLANVEQYQGEINRLDGLFGHCRFTIVHRDIFGVSRTVMKLGDDVYLDPLEWKETTNMYLLFGGSNTDERINVPIVYATREDWEKFRTALRNGEV